MSNIKLKHILCNCFYILQRLPNFHAYTYQPTCNSYTNYEQDLPCILIGIIKHLFSLCCLCMKPIYMASNLEKTAQLNT